MNRKTLIVSLGILIPGLLLCSILFRAWLNRPTRQDVIQKVFSSQEIYDVVATSTNVTAQLMHVRDYTQFNENQNWGKLNGYIIDPPIPLSSAQAPSIQHLLQNPASYSFNYAKRCIPDYGVLFAFHSGQQTVRIALCFKCDLLGVFTGTDDNQESVRSEINIDSVHGQLVAIAKSIFLSDPVIQSLKEER